MKTLRDFDVKNNRVLVRCGFDVPLDNQGNILDDFRIKETIPTIEYLVKKEAKVILMSHLGRPGGKIVPNLKLDKVQEKLTEYLGLSITKTPDCISPVFKNYSLKMEPGEILLLENLRFHKEEIEGDLKFAKTLSEFGDIYINDAFSVCHREHASIIGIPRYLPSGIGLLIEKEIKNLKRLMEKPEKPMVTIIGGKKVETKAKLINKILEISDFLLIGGLIKKEIEEKGMVLKYPQKVVEPIDSVRKGKKDLDIGPKTINLFKEKILKAKTIFWNGPLGMTEKNEFLNGTLEVAKAIVKSRTFSVAGGGETVEFLNRMGLTSKFSHVSTGGGAMLQFLGGEKLSGLEVLEKQYGG